MQQPLDVVRANVAGVPAQLDHLAVHRLDESAAHTAAGSVVDDDGAAERGHRAGEREAAEARIELGGAAHVGRVARIVGARGCSARDVPRIGFATGIVVASDQGILGAREARVDVPATASARRQAGEQTADVQQV